MPPAHLVVWIMRPPKQLHHSIQNRVPVHSHCFNRPCLPLIRRMPNSVPCRPRPLARPCMLGRRPVPTRVGFHRLLALARVRLEDRAGQSDESCCAELARGRRRRRIARCCGVQIRVLCLHWGATGSGTAWADQHTRLTNQRLQNKSLVDQRKSKRASMKRSQNL